MLPYIAEFLGTMILIILGDGVVANVNLNKSGMKGGGTVQITIAWGLAVMLPACIFGAASGDTYRYRRLLHWRSMELCMVYGSWIYCGTIRRCVRGCSSCISSVQRTV